MNGGVQRLNMKSLRLGILGARGALGDTPGADPSPPKSKKKTSLILKLLIVGGRFGFRQSPDEAREPIPPKRKNLRLKLFILEGSACGRVPLRGLGAKLRK